MPKSDINGVFEEIVAVIFGGQEVGTYCEPTTEKCGQAGADCAENPGCVEVPARHGKVLVVIEEEGLHEPHRSVNLGPTW